MNRTDIILPFQLHTVRGKGAVLRTSLGDDVTPENVRDAWAKVTDMSGAEHLSSITEATGSLVEILDSLNASAPATGSADSASGYSDTFTFNNKDLILYALGGWWPSRVNPCRIKITVSKFNFQLAQPPRIPSIWNFCTKIIRNSLHSRVTSFSRVFCCKWHPTWQPLHWNTLNWICHRFCMANSIWKSLASCPSKDNWKPPAPWSMFATRNQEPSSLLTVCISVPNSLLNGQISITFFHCRRHLRSRREPSVQKSVGDIHCWRW